MSGGVDSSVAAGLLVEQGYDVLGVFMRLGADHHVPRAAAGSKACDPSIRLPLATPPNNTSGARSRRCCSAEDADDARAVARRLGIPFYVLNFEREFGRLIDYFVDEYAAARTPNPCVRCNQWLKFGKLAAYADGIGAEFIATGHYARVEHLKDRSRLRRAVDTEKDQSYVLFGVPREVLRRTRFPLGELAKAEVRDHARRFGLTVCDKPESQDICFVPDGDYARLVRARRAEAFEPGEVRHVDGRLLGGHNGLANFTIGQRRGLGIAEGSPVYVTALDTATNTVVVGPKEATRSDRADIGQVAWLARAPTGPFRADVKIRYHHDAAPAWVTPAAGASVRVQFDVPQSAVTPGQAAVVYANDEVLGGGWIEGP